MNPFPHRDPRVLKAFADARAAEAKLADISRTRRPTEAETEEALRVYRHARRVLDACGYEPEVA